MKIFEKLWNPEERLKNRFIIPDGMSNKIHGRFPGRIPRGCLGKIPRKTSTRVFEEFLEKSRENLFTNK